MRLTIHSQDKLFTNPLKEYCEAKLSKPILRHQLDSEATNLDIDGQESGDEVEIRVRLSVPHFPVLTATAHHQDAYAAIDSVVDKLERQIRDSDERRRRLARKAGSDLPVLSKDDFFTEDEEDKLREIGALDAVIEA